MSLSLIKVVALFGLIYFVFEREVKYIFQYSLNAIFMQMFCAQRNRCLQRPVSIETGWWNSWIGLEFSHAKNQWKTLVLTIALCRFSGVFVGYLERSYHIWVYRDIHELFTRTAVLVKINALGISDTITKYTGRILRTHPLWMLHMYITFNKRDLCTFLCIVDSR